MEILLNRETAVVAMKTAAVYTDRPDEFNWLLFEAEESGVITITANGRNGQAVVPMEGEVKEAGKAMVRASMLVALISRVPSDKVTLKLGKADLGVRAGGHRYRVPIRADLSGAIPRHREQTGGLVMPAQELLDLLRFSSHAMGKNDVRYYLNGCCLAVAGKTVTVTASDGHRAASASWENTESVDHAFTVIIPGGTVEKLLATVSPEGDVSLQSDGESMTLVDGSGFRFSGQTVVGNFPDIGAVLPKTFATAKAPVQALLDAVDRVNIIAQGLNMRWVKLNIDDKELSASFDGIDSGMIEKIEVEAERAANGHWTVNPTYLQEALAAMPDETVLIRVQKDSDKPVRLDAGTTGNRVAVIMPVRV